MPVNILRIFAFNFKARATRLQGTRKSASMAACCQEIFLISQEIFKEKQDIKNEAREISKISTIRAYKYNNHNIKNCIMWQC